MRRESQGCAEIGAKAGRVGRKGQTRERAGPVLKISGAVYTADGEGDQDG